MQKHQFKKTREGIILEDIFRNQPLIMRSWEDICVIFSKLFFNLSGDNYRSINMQTMLLLRLGINISTLTFSTSFAMDINYLPAKSMQLQ